MPGPSPAEVILSAMPSQGRAYETSIQLKQQAKYDKERRAKESVASIDKMFAQMKEAGEEQDITNLSNAMTASKDPDAIETVLNQTPVKTARGAEYKMGLLQRIQQARESSVNIEQAKQAMAQSKEAHPLEMEAARLRRDYAKLQQEEAVALAPMARKEAKTRGLLLQTQARGAEATVAQQEWSNKTTREEYAAEAAMRNARREYESFEMTFDARMKKLQETRANVAAQTMTLKSYLAGTAEGRRLFGPASGLAKGEDRISLYNKLIDKAIAANPSDYSGEAQAELLSVVAGLAQTDADVRAAQFQRSEAVRSTIAQRFYPEAQRLVTSAVKRALDADSQILANPTPQGLENFLAGVKQRLYGNMESSMPSGDDVTLAQFGIERLDVWSVALTAALDQYESNLTRRVRTTARARQVQGIREMADKSLPPGATPEQAAAHYAQAMRQAGIDPMEGDAGSDSEGDELNIDDLDTILSGSD